MRTAIGVSMIGGGSLLIYAGFKNVSIWSQILQLVRDKPVAGATPAAKVQSTQTATQTVQVDSGTVPALVVIAGGHKLAPAAAAAYNAASSVYGKPIPITGAYRSLAAQATAYASDSDRFAPPDKSWHPKGLAIDVHSSYMNDPRLILALSGTGWQQSGLPKEPWHWSYGGRG